jgi:hypothetical protein
MDSLSAAVFGVILLAVSGPALAYALMTGRLWVGFFPTPETFAPERIRREEDPRRYRWNMLGQMICFAIGLLLLIPWDRFI